MIHRSDVPITFFNVFTNDSPVLVAKHLSIMRAAFNQLPWDYKHLQERQTAYLNSLHCNFLPTSLSSLFPANTPTQTVHRGLDELSTDEYKCYLNIAPRQRKLTISLSASLRDQHWFVKCERLNVIFEEKALAFTWLIEKMLVASFSRFQSQSFQVTINMTLIQNFLSSNQEQKGVVIEPCDFFCEWVLDRMNVHGGSSFLKQRDTNYNLISATLQSGQGLGVPYRALGQFYSNTPFQQQNLHHPAYRSVIHFSCDIEW